MSIRKTRVLTAAQAIEKSHCRPEVVYRAFREGRLRGYRDEKGSIFIHAVSFNEWNDALALKRHLSEKHRAIRKHSAAQPSVSQMTQAQA